MILIGLGANLPSAAHGAPRATLEAALEALAAAGIGLVRRSRWYRSLPLPPSDQPFYVNGVASVASELDPQALLVQLHGIEADFGRRRGARGAARVLDLDLLAHGERVIDEDGLHLPHKRLRERAFVLLPLRDVAPHWRHPVSGETIDVLIRRLGDDLQGVTRLD